jgi:type IX secretion system PorP/SprF family membrane protein
MKRFIVVLGLALTAVAGLDAQQLWRRSQFAYNTYMMNPATAGTQFYSPIMATYRNQWAGFKGAPVTYSLSGHTSLPNNIGVGGIFFSDNSGGAIRRTGTELTGSYRIDLNNVDAFSFGLSAVVSQFSFDNSSLVVYDQNDPALVPFEKESHMNFDANAGFLIYGPTYFFGVSVPQLIGTRLRLVSDADPAGNRNIRHFFVMGAYKYQLTEMFDLQGSGLMKFTAVTPVQLDVHIKANYADMFWGGFTLRPRDAVALFAGGQFNGFTLQYSYDITTTDARNLSPHSHELAIGYLIPRKNARFSNRSLLGPKRLDRRQIIH